MCEFTDLQDTLVQQGVLEKQEWLSWGIANIEAAQSVLSDETSNITEEWKQLIQRALKPVMQTFATEQLQW